MNRVLCAVLALFLSVGAALGAAPAFAAPTPSPTPGGPVPTYVAYTGHATSSYGTDFSSHGTLPSSIKIDCSSGECVVTQLIIDDTSEGNGIIDMSQGRRLVLVDGKGTYQMSAFGSTCGGVYFAAGTLTLTATATGFTGVRTTEASVAHCNGGTGTVEAGTYTATATVSGGNPCVLDSSCPTPSPTPTAKPASTASKNAAGPTSKYTKSTRIASPSTLSALPTASTALTFHGVLWSAAVAVVLVLLIAFPTYLFNSATDEGATKVREWWDKRRPKTVARLASAREVEYKGWPLAAIGLLAASLISSFVDPTFGFNASSVRVYLSILVSFLLDAVAGWFLLIWLVRRARPHTTATFKFSPISLIVVLGAVLFTRLTGFAPGIIFGLVAGVAFGAVLAAAEKARVALVGLGYSFGVAVIAWIGYSALTATVGAHPGAWVVFVQETLSSISIGGIAALPIALVPIRGLSGYDIFAWNRWVWGGAYAIGLVGFFVVLMPLPTSWAGVHVNLVIWIAVYVAYSLAAVGVWLAIHRPWKRESTGSVAA